MLNPFVLSLVRYGLTAAGGILVASGYMSEEMVAQAVGGVLALIPAVWSVFERRKTASIVAEARAIIEAAK